MPSKNIPVNGWPQIKELDIAAPILAELDKIEAWQKSVKQETKSGAYVEFTNALALYASSVIAEITASQDLHGYDNPWVGGAGKNKWGNGNISGTRVVSITSLSYPLSAGTYTFSAVVVSSDTDDTKCLIYDTTNNAELGRIDRSVGDARVSLTFSTASEITSLNIYASTSYVGSEGDTFSFTDIQIESGSTATSYAPYTNICPITGFSSVVITDVDAESHTATVTVSLGSTVYGGTLNLTTGELTVNTVSKTYTGETDEAWDGDVSLNSYWSTATIGNKAKGDIICNEFEGVKVNTWNDLHDYEIAFHPTVANTLRVKYSGVANLTAFKAFLASSPMQVVYELATPTTTTLTAEQLEMVKGYNRISANSGNIEVTAYTGNTWN